MCTSTRTGTSTTGATDALPTILRSLPKASIRVRTSAGRLDSVRKLRPWFEIGRDLPELTSMRLLILSDLHLEWATLRWLMRSTSRRSRSRTTGRVASASQRASPRGYRDRHGFENESFDPPLVADVAESAAYRKGRA